MPFWTARADHQSFTRPMKGEMTATPACAQANACTRLNMSEIGVDVLGFKFMGSSNPRHSCGDFYQDSGLWDVKFFEDSDQCVAFSNDSVMVVSEARINRDGYTTRNYVQYVRTDLLTDRELVNNFVGSKLIKYQVVQC